MVYSNANGPLFLPYGMQYEPPGIRAKLRCWNSMVYTIEQGNQQYRQKASTKIVCIWSPRWRQLPSHRTYY